MEVQEKPRLRYGEVFSSKRTIASLIGRYVTEMARPEMRPIGRTDLGRYKLLQGWPVGAIDAEKLKKSDLIEHCRWRRQTVMPATATHDITCSPREWRLARGAIMEPAIYSVVEYESGWYVEKPDPIAPLHDCKFIQVAGPFKREAVAERWVNKLLQRDSA